MPTDELLVGIDVGTGGCKVSIIDSSAAFVTESRVTYPSRYPQPGWVEQNPSDWLKAVEVAMDAVMRELSDDQRQRVKAIGLSGPTHVAVLKDEHGAVMRPAIMWNDQRSGAQARRLAQEFGRALTVTASNVPTPTWTLPQLEWLVENEPQTMAKVAHISLMKDWVREALSSTHSGYTDRVDAQGTLLFDLTTRQWSTDLLARIGLPLDAFPKVVEPTKVVDTLRPDFAERWGMRQDVPMVAGTTDTAAELLAAGVIEEGDAAIKIASAGNVALVARGRPLTPDVLCYEHIVSELNYWNSATSSAAASLKWFTENFTPHAEAMDYVKVDKAVAAINPGAGGIIFTPFLHGERAPRFDEKLRAGFLGLTAEHSWQEATRAVMEGVAFSLRDAATLFPPVPARLRLVGGGARSEVWPQIIADVFDRDLSVPTHADSSIGAALVAGVGVGVFNSLEWAGANMGGAQRQFSPNQVAARFYDHRFADYRALADATTALSHSLARDSWPRGAER